MGTNASVVLDALGDPMRRAILERLASEGSKPVGLLADQLPISRPAVSQHLRVLKEAGLVRETPAGTRRLYQINPDGFGVLRAYLDQFWRTTLGNFAALASAGTRDPSSTHQADPPKEPQP